MAVAALASDSNFVDPLSTVVVRPKIAVWASSVVIGVVVSSFALVYWICPKYFVENSDPSNYGGAAGAVDVVKRGIS